MFLTEDAGDLQNNPVQENGYRPYSLAGLQCLHCKVRTAMAEQYIADP